MLKLFILSRSHLLSISHFGWFFLVSLVARRCLHLLLSLSTMRVRLKPQKVFVTLVAMIRLHYSAALVNLMTRSRCSFLQRSRSYIGRHDQISTNAILLHMHRSAVEDAPQDEQLHFPSLYGKTLVSVQDCQEAYQLQQQSESKELIFIDASWYHRPDPVTNIMRNPIKEFQEGPRIPNAQYLDIDELATTYDLFPGENPLKLPHMMPPPTLFGMAMDAYGIRNNNHVIIYAKRGAVFTPRTWFLFLSMGHDLSKVHLMQGSLEDWMESGGDVETNSLLNDHNKTAEGDYSNCFECGILNVPKLHSFYNKADSVYQLDIPRAAHICNKKEVLRAVNNCIAEDKSTIILDTRGSGYSQKGHMPSAIHLPYRELLNPSNLLQLKSISELHTVFSERSINYQDPNQKIILSCGSGVSVCHGFLAMKILGREITEENTRIYDGSWKEWGRLDDKLPRVLPGNIKKK